MFELYNKRRIIRCMAVLLVSLTTASFAAAQPAYELRSGVLINPAQKTAFLMGPEGVDAIRLDRGTLAWHSDRALKPLALHEGVLVAQAASETFGGLDLVVLDASQGNMLRTVSVELPKTVFAHIEDALGSTFEIRANPDLESSDAVHLTWQFEYQVSQGAVFNEPTTPSVSEHGMFTFDPQSGAVSPAASPENLALQDPLVEASQRLPGISGRQFKATAGDHILASSQVNNDSAWNKYRWTVFTTQGQRLGSLDTHAAYASFAVVDSALLFETRPFERRQGDAVVATGPMLKGFDLATGVEQWSWLLRDTEYRGPHPP